MYGKRNCCVNLAEMSCKGDTGSDAEQKTGSIFSNFGHGLFIFTPSDNSAVFSFLNLILSINFF